MSLNIALKTAILTAGVTQDEIARETGIHPSRFSRIVRGWLEPSLAEKKDIAKALRRPMSELFHEKAIAS